MRFCEIWDKLKTKMLRFLKTVWAECKCRQTFVILLLVIAVLYSPVWVGYLLYFIFGFGWCLAMATACLVFWAGPFTPFFPLCIALALSIKRILDRKKEKQAVESKKISEKS